MTLRPFMALWPYGSVVLWLHRLAQPQSLLTSVFPRSHPHGSSGPQVARTRLQWSACRARTAPGDRRSRAHGSYRLQVACARLLCSTGRARTASVVCRSRAHGPSGQHVARARLQWSAGRARTAPAVRRSRTHGPCQARRPCPLVSFDLTLCVIVQHH